jgi:hypothetical protein
VNLAGAQLRQPNLLGRIEQLLNDNGLSRIYCNWKLPRISS